MVKYIYRKVYTKLKLIKNRFGFKYFWSILLNEMINLDKKMKIYVLACFVYDRIIYCLHILQPFVVSRKVEEDILMMEFIVVDKRENH